MADNVVEWKRRGVHKCSFEESQRKESTDYCEGKRDKHGEERGS